MASKKETPLAATGGASRESLGSVSTSSNSRSAVPAQSAVHQNERGEKAAPGQNGPAGAGQNFAGELIWELEKYGGKLIVGEREYHGKRFVDFRHWVGEFGDKPTAKGVTIPLPEVEGLAVALLAHVDGRALSAPERETDK